MWFKVRYDMDQGKWRYWAGEEEVDHREWQARQYRQDNPERRKR